jgi:hypothetical protein
MAARKAHAALGVPDVLRVIFEQLANDRLALYAAARANHTWSAHALDILWHSPPETAFVCVAPARRQFYADKVRSLIVRRHYALFRPLAFPHLRAVRFELIISSRKSTAASSKAGAGAGAGGSTSDDGGFGQYFGPQLERLRTMLNPEMVRLLLERRPRLRELDIKGVEGDIDWSWAGSDDEDEDADAEKHEETGGAGPGGNGPSGRPEKKKKKDNAIKTREITKPDFDAIKKRLIAYANARAAAPPLPASDQRRVLELFCGSDVIETLMLRDMDSDVMDDALVRLLAPHKTLASLTLGYYAPTPSLLEDIAARVPRPFSALQRLHLEITPAALAVLVRLVPSLKKLELEVLEVATRMTGRTRKMTMRKGMTIMMMKSRSLLRTTQTTT